MAVIGGDENGGGGGDGGGEREASSPAMKKGPWVSEEDDVLIAYVKKHGEGNWNAVMRNSGLQRCGKSCRLRWANHLRPNLKKGTFSPEEERTIIQLHAKYGNKWARMAAQLPGRTDNEIKNYWNTRLKRRQRAGLSIYPQEMQREAVEFHLQEQQNYKSKRHKHDHDHQHPISLSLIDHIVPIYNHNFSQIENFKILTPINPIQLNQNSSFFSNPSNQTNFFPSNNYNNDGFSIPLSPVSSSLSPPLINQSFTSLLLPTQPSTIQFNLENNFGFRSTDNIMGNSDVEVGPNEFNDVETLFQEKNSGLLGDMLKESKIISRKYSNKLSKGEDNLMDAFIVVDDATAKSDFGEKNGDSNQILPLNQFEDSRSAFSSIVKKPILQEQVEEMTSFDDDDGLSSILSTFNTSNVISTSFEGGNLVLEAAQEASHTPSSAVSSSTGATTMAMNDDHDLTLGFCWNYMPTIS